MKLIVMLTNHDKTVANAAEVFESCKSLPVQDWGFKDIGIPTDEMKKLVKLMKDANKTTYLEVVTYTEEECLRGANIAIECEFDFLMGTVYYESVHKLLKDANVKYYPFSGHVWDNPSKLGDSVEGIAESGMQLQSKGVDGTDILAYRFIGDNVEELIESFMKSVTFPVVIAGSIDSRERLDYMKRIKPAGITMGSALFAKKFVPNGTFCENLEYVVQYLK